MWQYWIIGILVIVSVILRWILSEEKERFRNAAQKHQDELKRIEETICSLDADLAKEYGSDYLYKIVGAPEGSRLDPNGLPIDNSSDDSYQWGNYSVHMSLSTLCVHDRQCRYAKHLPKFNIYECAKNRRAYACSLCGKTLPDFSWVPEATKYITFFKKYAPSSNSAKSADESHSFSVNTQPDNACESSSVPNIAESNDTILLLEKSRIMRDWIKLTVIHRQIEKETAIQEYRDKIRADPDKQRSPEAKINYRDVDSFSLFDDFQNDEDPFALPPGVYIESGGSLRLGRKSQMYPYGNYTVFTTNNSNFYHSWASCSGRQASCRKNLFDLIDQKTPCPACWKNIYHKVPKWYLNFVNASKEMDIEW